MIGNTKSGVKMPTKQDFLVSECWILSWGASVQRAGLYRATATEGERRRFRKKIISFVTEEVLPDYTTPVSEHDHEVNITRIADFGSRVGSRVLRSQDYRIGVVQKLFNLQLKYLWCLGISAEPPHCPVDRVMIGKTSLRGTVNWTRIANIATYRQVVSALKEAAEPTGLSLARWELECFDRAEA